MNFIAERLWFDKRIDHGIFTAPPVNPVTISIHSIQPVLYSADAISILKKSHGSSWTGDGSLLLAKAIQGLLPGSTLYAIAGKRKPTHPRKSCLKTCAAVTMQDHEVIDRTVHVCVQYLQGKNRLYIDACGSMTAERILDIWRYDERVEDAVLVSLHGREYIIQELQAHFSRAQQDDVTSLRGLLRDLFPQGDPTT